MGNKNLLDGWQPFEELVVDAYKFLRYFGMPMAESTPHIYISALPFTPVSSTVYKVYARALPNTFTFECGQQTNWPALEMTISTSSEVFSVAFSPDGQNIASAMKDGTVCMWNTTTGRKEGDPLTGHSNVVQCVTFSRDGRRIASGSTDSTIRVWDALTTEDESLITLHTKWVASVAMSPGETCAALGSNRQTASHWDMSTAKPELGAFSGPASKIISIAFSPDGQWIASGAENGVVCVWNMSSEEQQRILMTGHLEEVCSVAFSPDGKRVASGSKDRTIRVWNICSESLDLQHTCISCRGSVTSVAFSPDGEWIVSGSSDQTICLWNASTGVQERGPFKGHTRNVSAVAVSPDGKWIVSGSFDKTVRLWDTLTGKVERGPFTAHTNSITSVAFSPDGNQIVSASLDKTVRVWNAFTGEPGQLLPARAPQGLNTQVGSSMERPHISKAIAGTIQRVLCSGDDDADDEVSFNDQSVIDADGWICGEQGQLLLWIPYVHRQSLYHPNSSIVLGPNTTRLNMSNFVHGSNWATCHKNRHHNGFKLRM